MVGPEHLEHQAETLGVPTKPAEISHCTPGTPGTPESNGSQAGMRVRWIHSPLFGPCKLVRHDMNKEPTTALGYVERAHTGGTLKLALYQNGQWRTTGLKPIGGTVTAWYSLEREDGRSILEA